MQVFREAKRKSSLLHFSHAHGKGKREKDYFFQEMLTKYTSPKDSSLGHRKEETECGLQSRGWFVQMIPDERKVTTHKHENSHATCLRVDALS